MHRTPEQIRIDGLDALRKRLGRAGLIRFMQQFDQGSGDYVRQRRKWSEQTTLDELRAAARGLRSRKSRRAR